MILIMYWFLISNQKIQRQITKKNNNQTIFTNNKHIHKDIYLQIRFILELMELILIRIRVM